MNEDFITASGTAVQETDHSIPPQPQDSFLINKGKGNQSPAFLEQVPWLQLQINDQRLTDNTETEFCFDHWNCLNSTDN